MNSNLMGSFPSQSWNCFGHSPWARKRSTSPWSRMPTLPDKFLQQDLTAVTHPDINRPFQSKEDVFARLAPFHIFNSPQPEFEKSEGGEKVFEGVRLAEEALRNFHKRLKVRYVVILSYFFSFMIKHLLQYSKRSIAHSKEARQILPCQNGDN